MSREEQIERSIENAVASVEMEGFHIDEECRNWCRLVLMNEMTKEEYFLLLLKKAEVMPL